MQHRLPSRAGEAGRRDRRRRLPALRLPRVGVTNDRLLHSLAFTGDDDFLLSGQMQI
jgi:hypothetical protein